MSIGWYYLIVACLSFYTALCFSALFRVVWQRSSAQQHSSVQDIFAKMGGKWPFIAKTGRFWKRVFLFPDLFSWRCAILAVIVNILPSFWLIASAMPFLALGWALISSIILVAVIVRKGYQPLIGIQYVIMLLLLLATSMALVIMVGILLSLFHDAWRFFQGYSFIEFIFGLDWNPQVALHDGHDQSQIGAFGFLPLLLGSIMITAVALVVALPVGITVAIYLSQYSTRSFRNFLKPALELLAGIPTVVYGFLAVTVVAPYAVSWGDNVGLEISPESALVAGLVVALTVIPYVSSLLDDVLCSLPKNLTDGSLAMGATRYETIRYVLLPAALPGIVSAFILSFSRAIGETMIVVMAAGLGAYLTANPLQGVTTITVQIATLLSGDQGFDSLKTLSAFGLGITLFILTLLLNVFAFWCQKFSFRANS